MTPRQIYLIRHGETEGTSTGRLLGSTDLPLTSAGRRQVQRLADLLPACLFTPEVKTWCVASPLRRAQETAAAVSCARGLLLETDPDLREIDFGTWEGLTAQEIEARFPDKLQEWASPVDDTAFPGGESLGEFDRRVNRARGRIVEQDAEAVLVFAHGGVVRALICGLLGLGREGFWLFDVQPASVARVTLLEGGAFLSGLWAVPDEEEG